jgi:leucyl/phenylalanyl-tRNA--protein transferase
MIPWISAGDPFPPVESASKHRNGLLAASEVLDVEQLVRAYAQGIFPWYSDGEPVLWWSPDPRMVLRVDDFRIGRSLAKRLRQAKRGDRVAVTLDTAFDDVMRQCAAPRNSDSGTWITGAIRSAYGELHRLGLAHSVETWFEGRLVGGLYFVSLGSMIFGESMFTRMPDASKIALSALVNVLRAEGAPMIDCQQDTRHLASLGARTISRHEFVGHVERATRQPPIPWARYARQPLRSLLDLPSSRSA